MRRNWLLAVGALGFLTGCGNESNPDSKRWVRVARDANYEIAIDTTRIEPHGLYGYLVWYRTDHAAQRLHKGKPFNREVVQSELRCKEMEFKVVSVDLSMGSARPISEQRTEPRDLEDQKWRTVERGTTEEMAATAACHFARRQYPQQWKGAR